MALHQAARTMTDLGGDAKVMYLGLDEVARDPAILTREADMVCVSRQAPPKPKFRHRLKNRLRRGLKRQPPVRPLGPEVDARLLKFGVEAVTKMPANSHFVVPEIWPELADRLLQLGCKNVYFWWLSVDNFPLTQMQQLFTRRVIRESRNLCQSEYAARFARAQGGVSVSMLSDFIEFEEVQNPKPVSDRTYDIAYLPNKARGAEALLRNLETKFKVIALQNMPREQVASVLSDTRIFLDFGAHPGKDRVPREAALCGCIPVVRKEGAACFPEDVPLPNDLLIETSQFFEPDALVQKLQRILSESPQFEPALRDYRAAIRQEKAVFEREIRDLISAARQS